MTGGLNTSGIYDSHIEIFTAGLTHASPMGACEERSRSKLASLTEIPAYTLYLRDMLRLSDEILYKHTPSAVQI